MVTSLSKSKYHLKGVGGRGLILTQLGMLDFVLPKIGLNPHWGVDGGGKGKSRTMREGEGGGTGVVM